MCRIISTLLALAVAVSPAFAQKPDLRLDATLVFYGDDTEFFNQFRVGETQLGTFGTVVLEADLSDRLSVRAGAFGHQRFGSSASVDQAKPVLALVIRGPHSRVILGTLETLRRADGPGPDRAGQHGLLPPIQRETIAFERPFEAGLQWTVNTARLTQDSWVHWQRLNDHTTREVFDVGLANVVHVRPEFALRHNLHVVHQGGQLGGVEPVADSVAAALGVDVGGPVGRLDRLGLEAFVLGSRYVPDRQRPSDSENGFATFVRASIDRAPWRLHAILWRADDFIKVEGDPLYHSLRRDGSRYGPLRDYAEVGVTRTFQLAPDSTLESSLRVHRVENAYDYSFRILGVARLRMPVTPASAAARDAAAPPRQRAVTTAMANPS